MSIDTILGVVGTILGIVGLVTGYIFYRRSLRIKEPVYYITGNNLIQDSASKISGLEILHKGHKIKTLSVSKVLFWNKGYDTIEKSDMVAANPLRIECPQGNRILDVNVIATNNPSSQFTVEVEENKTCAKILFDYVDKDEGAVIQVVHTGIAASDISIEGKFKGATIRKRKYVPRRNLVFKFQPWIGFAVIFTGLTVTENLTMFWRVVFIAVIVIVWVGISSGTMFPLWKKLSGPFDDALED